MKHAQQKKQDSFKIISTENRRVNTFGNNITASKVYAQAEKIIIATHMVTNLIPSSEPIKDKLRNESQKLLEQIISLRAGFQSSGDNSLIDVFAQITFIKSLLSIAQISNLVSEMNTQVLQSAYTNLEEVVQNNQGEQTAESLTLLREYLDADAQENFSKGHSNLSDTLKDTQHSKGHTNKMSDRNIGKEVSETENQFAHFDGSQESLEKEIKPKRTRRKSDKSIATKNARQQIIINFIKEKGKAYNKDLGEVLTGVSSKTIQRELTNLIKKGVLKKEGERRWSVYYLA